MKKICLGCILLLFMGNSLYAQEQTTRLEHPREKGKTSSDHFKGSYLTVGASIGSSSFNYKLNSLGETGSRKGSLGYGMDIRYSYFFSTHWGIASGVGFSYYGTTGKLKGGMSDNHFYDLGKLTDNDWQPAPKDYALRTRISNLEEKQTSYLFEIPLMLSYQTYFREESSCWGLYGGLGVKLQLPVSSKFKIENGPQSEFNVSGQYDGIPTDLGAPSHPPVPQHGYGTISDPNSTLHWDDKAKLKMGIAATAELGVLFSLGKNTDLLVGGYIDYGLTNIKKKSDRGLFTAPLSYHPSAENKIGEGIQYNGMLNTNTTDKIRPVSFGGKIALRFKL